MASYIRMKHYQSLTIQICFPSVIANIAESIKIKLQLLSKKYFRKSGRLLTEVGPPPARCLAASRFSISGCFHEE